MKLKPCKPPRERHDWEHYSNKTVTRRFADGSVELRRRGIYYCTACTAAKYGEAREQVHVVVGHEPPNVGIEPPYSVGSNDGLGVCPIDATDRSKP